MRLTVITRPTWYIFLLLIFLALSEIVTASPVKADTSSNQSSIGVRLLDVPQNLANDPRAQIYIIDHLAPGTTIHRRFEISNTSFSPQTVETYAGAASIASGSFQVAPTKTQDALSSWITLSTSTIVVLAKSSAIVEATLAVPSDASAGEQYAVIWAQISSPSTTQPGVLLIERVGIRMYVDIGPGGAPPSDFEIQSLTGSRSQTGQPEVIALVNNTGHRALDMSGTLNLSNGPGSLSAGPFAAQTGSTLAPGSKGTVAILLNPQLPDGPWEASLTLSSGLITHTATATILFPAAFGTKSPPQQPDSLNWLLILLSAGFLLLIAVLVLWKKRLHSRIDP